MSYVQCPPEKPQLIAVNRLEKSPLNARRTYGTMGMEELKASILSHGLMQNLVVTATGDGTYLVIAGGRRLEAIRSLQAEGKLPAEFTVPCQIVLEQQAREMSLAENTVRLAMHPADQFEAFAALIEQGASAADVATRFGIDESTVLKRMKLARVASELLAEYRNEGMSLECLMAYTVTDDHRRQLRVFKSLQGWRKDDAREIRAALTDTMVESTGKLARFVGLDAYKQAGGTTRADLFEERIYLEQPALLHQLADEKLTGIRKELGDEGWSWVEVNPERADDFIHRCGRIKPHLIGVPKDLVELKSELDEELEFVEHAYLEVESDGSLEKRQAILDRLDGVERTLTEYVGFDATQKALAGCYVSIGHDGSLFLDKGLVKPEHRKLLGKLLGREDDTPVKVKPKDALPEKLRRDLASDRLQVAKVEIARHPAIARDVLVFRVASELLGGKRPSDGPDIQFYQTKSGRDREPSLAARELAALEKELPTGWLKGKTEAARFEVFCSIPEEAKSQLLAYCVAMTLQPALGRTESGEITAYDAALLKTAGQVSAYWRPSKANFLSRITREQLLAVGSEVLGEPWAVAHHGDKKAALVDQLDRAFSNPDKSGRTPDQIDKLKRWLPKGMAFDLGTQSKPAKSKKARKAA